MDQIQSEFSETSQIFTIGNTFEGRPIKGIRITKNIENPAIFIESNIHAREWITSATSVWLIDQFLRSSNETVRSFVDGITWYIIPVLNADGKCNFYKKNLILFRKISNDFQLLLTL